RNALSPCGRGHHKRQPQIQWGEGLAQRTNSPRIEPLIRQPSAATFSRTERREQALLTPSHSPSQSTREECKEAVPVATPSPLAGEGIAGANHKFSGVRGWLSGQIARG